MTTVPTTKLPRSRPYPASSAATSSNARALLEEAALTPSSGIQRGNFGVDHRHPERID
jgi:hypothetical protein